MNETNNATQESGIVGFVRSYDAVMLACYGVWQSGRNELATNFEAWPLVVLILTRK